ncbi:hypothetical protein SC481_14440, partial [Legionella pneumophila]
MAIKKGAFELYTQERKLPEKKESSHIKKSHFFDDVYSKNKGSQLVHERFTTGEGILTEDQQNHSGSDSNNNGNIGSQMVHERFTTGEGRLAEDQQNHSDSDSNNNGNIGSQMVHERFTTGEGRLAEDQQNHSDS